MPTIIHFPWIHLTTLLAFTLLSNVVLGYLRQSTRKGSAIWFFYIHASIPFIVWMRTAFDFGWHVIPFTLAGAILGQLGGSWIRRRDNS